MLNGEEKRKKFAANENKLLEYKPVPMSVVIAARYEFSCNILSETGNFLSS